MTREHKDGLYLVLLGAAIFLLIGLIVQMAAPVKSIDYRAVYFSTRCFLEHRDPYNAGELRRTVHDEGSESWDQIDKGSLMERKFIYLPTVFVFSSAFALLPFALSNMLWLAGLAAVYVFAAGLIWRVCAQQAPLLAGALVALVLASSELFFALGNPAGYAIALTAVAVCCFLEDRFIAAGVLCLALSLMLKPHDGWLIWLFLLLAGGRLRRCALWTAGAVAVLSMPVLWELWRIAPQWPGELHAIFSDYSAVGSVNDPGPTGMTALSTVMNVSLQPVFSLVSDNPAFYNAATYLVCGALLLPWSVRVARTKPEGGIAWMAIAPAAVLSLLPVYHRSYDARLLLLAVPACVQLWKRNRLAGWVGASLVALGTVVTAGIPWSILAQAMARYPELVVRAPATLRGVVTGTAPLSLLLAGVFFLSMFLRALPDVAGADGVLQEDS